MVKIDKAIFTAYLIGFNTIINKLKKSLDPSFSIYINLL